ncbi:rrn6p [Saccharomyces arboricola H-6]|uniref:Rrn6p n=1 Tax=Saccharomyces arboricola (strain H-6 / AS 2.3317 / CBS 10644) TaxID=1160507 RepID=J8Q4I0_SACAR|nr:rrn6p [Saccharomyces arboricola H-6]
MSEGQLPGSDVLGSQLGVGVQGASLYCPRENYGTKKPQSWLRPVDDTLPTRGILDLHIVSKSVLCDTDIRYISDEKILQESDHDDDLITSDVDEEVDEVQNTSIVVDPVAPVVPKHVHFFKKVDVDNDPMFNVNCDTPVALQDYIPSDLLDNLNGASQKSAGSSRSRQDALFWDPTVANRMDTECVQTASDLRNYRDGTEIIVYASGKTNSLLNIAALTRQDTLHLNRHNNVTSIELHSPIKSIKIPKTSESIGRRSNLVGVVTENSFQIFRIESIHSRSSDVIITSSEPLYFVEIDDIQIADFAFNPWDLQQFAIIDIRGNWNIGMIPKNFNNKKAKLQLVDNLQGTIFDPEELSSWKKIEWFSQFQKIVVFDRSKMIEIDFINDWQAEVVQAKTWSDIRDYKRVNDKNGILLTSREIIIIGASEGDEAVRKLSWKHDLDPADTTLKMTLQVVRKSTRLLLLAFVYSMRHKHIYIHTFSQKKSGAFQSLGYSTVLEIPGGTLAGIEVISTMDQITENGDGDGDDGEEENDNHSSEFVTDFSIRLKDSSKIYHYTLSNASTPESSEKENIIVSDHTDWTTLFSSANSRERESIDALVSQIKMKEREHMSRIQALIGNESDHDEDKYLQDLGYRLSIATNELLQSWQATRDACIHNGSMSYSKLNNLVEDSNSFTSISEFSSLLDQFFQYYEDQDVTFIDFKRLLGLLLHEDVSDLDIFYNKLLQCWILVSPQAELYTKEVVKDIVWSLVSFEKPSLLEPIQKEITQSLGRPYQDIVDSWDMDDLNEEDESNEFNFDNQFSTTRFNGRSQFNLNSQSQIPTIKSSQNNGLARKKRILKTQSQKAAPLSQSTQNLSVLPDSMTPAFTLMQPPSSQISFVNDSQIRSSQRAKKKKKRIRGFG